MLEHQLPNRSRWAGRSTNRLIFVVLWPPVSTS